VERLLDAAAELVVTAGVEGLSTRGIASAAGVPVASLYQYFADRDDVLLALVERDIELMDRQVQTDLAGLDRCSVAILVRTTMDAFVTSFRARPSFVVIWLRGRTNQAIQDYGREHNRQVARDLYQLGRAFGLLTEEAELFHVDLAVEIGDRLFQIAFESDLAGDPAILHEAVKVVTQYLELYATRDGMAGVPAGKTDG
jgi:AcrR family transcriptional regulator